MRMDGRMFALDDVLTPVLKSLRPVAPISMKVADAIGLVLAAPVIAQAAIPAAALALRAGLAVNAFDLVGATAQSPVAMTSLPALVAAGALLPDGCNAVLDPAAAEDHGSHVEVTQSIEPGHDVRLAGHDLAAGTHITQAGERLTAEAALVAQLAGVVTVMVCRPVVRIGMADTDAATWLSASLAKLGCLVAARHDVVPQTADVCIRTADLCMPRLALQPGELAWVAKQDGVVIVDMPGRFDGVVASYLAVILPIVACFLGQRQRTVCQPLMRKLTSAIGTTDVALLRRRDGQFDVLCVGEMTLTALVRADHFVLVPPGSEGVAAGEPIAATPITEPLMAADRTDVMLASGERQLG